MSTTIEVVVFDWAGTTVDHGCCAPPSVFVEVFRRHGVAVSDAQARGPMGMHKRDHIAALMALPDVAAQWTAHRGQAPTDADVGALYEEATPLQMECLPDYADPIDGVVEVIDSLVARGIRIGSTTGYNRRMLDVLAAESAKKGYAPEVALSADDAPKGRPAPYLCWEAAKRLGASSTRVCVKVGDTVVDVEAGRNAGFWTVGVAETGNLMGLTAPELAALPEAERAMRRDAARAKLAAAGAHLVVDSLVQFPDALDTINARLAEGLSP